ncbi:ATP-binding protein [Aliarcobacter butzleri]|uniref:ATP-binding protein n=1 Tax=Aliarcobacter butzleri TaxID=28197 RepID=UPI003B22127E
MEEIINSLIIIIEKLEDDSLEEKQRVIYFNSIISNIENVNSNQDFVDKIIERGLVQEIKKLISNTLKFVLDNYSDKYTIILKISNLLASFDTNIVRFSVDAGIIDRLGKELVSKHDTAVSELVKNAYDADAKIVKLEFKNASNTGGTLIIEDDGEGMTRSKLVNGFMRLSSGDKIHNPVSLKYERKKAGRKGIGRFATQRLGKQLTIITQTKINDYALKLVINWDDFSLDSEVGLIENKIERIDKIKDNGTTLIITDLRDIWSTSAIERAYKYVSDLLQPFPLSKESENLNIDPGFYVECLKTDINESKIIANDKVSFFEHATAEIEGYIDFDGQGYYSINSNRYNLVNEVEEITSNEENGLFNKIRNIHLKAYYYIYEANAMPKNAISMIRNKLRLDGGIRLYRNGFRVPPYGQNPDDWLNLDESVRRKTLLFPHANNSFFGFIEVVDEKGEIFEEQSSREGLLNNDAFEELTEFGFKALTAAATRIAEIRDRKVTTNQKDWIPKSSKEKLENAFNKFENVFKESINNQQYQNKEQDNLESEDNEEQNYTNSESTQQTYEEAFNEFKKAKEEFEKETDEKIIELIGENSMLRVLAGLGLTIGEFIHEIKFYQAALHGDADNLIDALVEQKAQEPAIRIKEHLKSLNTYTAYFDKTISQNVQRELENIELRDVVRPFINVISKDAESSGIKIHEAKFNGYNLYTCPMHKSEWTSILFNLYTNAKKAIKKAHVSGEIFILCGKEENIIYLEFSDNGIGIPEDKKERIFNAFYTTSTPVGKFSDEHNELRGTGLGLNILKDIIHGYGGLIKVVEPFESYKSTIRIEIPRKKER